MDRIYGAKLKETELKKQRAYEAERQKYLALSAEEKQERLVRAFIIGTKIKSAELMPYFLTNYMNKDEFIWFYNAWCGFINCKVLCHEVAK